MVPRRAAIGPNLDGVLSLRASGAVAALQIAAVALGIARAAIDAFKDVAMTKTPHGATSGSRVSADGPRAGRLCRGAGSFGQAYYYETVREVARQLAAGDEVTEELSANVRLACAHTAQNAVDALDLMFAPAASAATYASSRLDRCFPDIHMATQHVTISASKKSWCHMLARFSRVSPQVGRHEDMGGWMTHRQAAEPNRQQGATSAQRPPIETRSAP